MDWIYILDLFGTFIFAISGVVTAIQKKFDLVGTLVVGFVTAIGGGTLRDMMVGRFPVGWLNDRNYFLAIIMGYIIAYLFMEKVKKYKKGMFLFDTIGIGLFTILGVKIGIDYNLNLEICLLLGVVSACFGGVIRDVLTNEIPLIFRHEIYASACLIGGIIYLILAQINPIENINILISMLTVMLVRYFSIKNKWSLDLDVK